MKKHTMTMLLVAGTVLSGGLGVFGGGGAVPAGAYAHEEESFVEYFQRRNQNKIDPVESAIFYEKGLRKFEEGNVDRALTFFQRSVYFTYYDSNALFMVGLCHQKRGKLARALRYYERAVYFDRSFADAYFRMGEVYLLMGDIESARSQLKVLEGMDSPASSRSAEELRDLIQARGTSN
jgi:tetratricopeptide (TPR) repeat protein